MLRLLMVFQDCIKALITQSLSSDSRAINENSLVPWFEDGIMDDEEYVSSSLKLSET